MNCIVFIWLSLKFRIWKSDRRVSGGLQATMSPCSFCLQEYETTDHLLVQCVLPIPQIQCLILLSCKLSGRNARVFGNNHQVFPEARLGDIIYQELQQWIHAGARSLVLIGLGRTVGVVPCNICFFFFSFTCPR
ncbi:hypothetical protein VPH35_072787 [Triticum aestivum]